MKTIHTISVKSWIHCQQEFHRRGRNCTREKKTSCDNGYIPYFPEKIPDYPHPAVILLHHWPLIWPSEMTRLDARLPDLYASPLLCACTLNRSHTLGGKFTGNQCVSFPDYPTVIGQAQ